MAADWEVKGQVGFSDLQKLNLKGAVKAETLKEAGSLFFYDKTFDRVTSKLEKKVVRTQDTNVSKPSASDDPVLQKMAAAGEGDVFCTDQTLAKLMACTRSIYSWDVVATIKDGKIFLDKKDNKADLLSVGETAAEAPQDDKDAGVNSVDALAKEATDVNHNFLQQVTSKSKPAHSLGEPPFDDPNPTAAPAAYRYRRFETPDGLKVVCRCQIDAAMEKDSDTQLIFVKALHEWDAKLGVNWRKNIDSQRGAVLATEIRNNSNKLAQWAIKALLAEVDQIKIGYISRHTPKDAARHSILGTQFYQPQDFASQMALSMSNCWGVLDHMVNMLDACGEGTFIFLRDPNKPLLRLYAPPAAAI